MFLTGLGVCRFSNREDSDLISSDVSLSNVSHVIHLHTIAFFCTQSFPMAIGSPTDKAKPSTRSSQRAKKSLRSSVVVVAAAVVSLQQQVVAAEGQRRQLLQQRLKRKRKKKTRT